jgi:hypothetical protein
VLANLTVDKWMKIPMAGPVMSGGWIVRCIFTPDAADGSDASDCVIQSG